MRFCKTLSGNIDKIPFVCFSDIFRRTRCVRCGTWYHRYIRYRSTNKKSRDTATNRSGIGSLTTNENTGLHAHKLLFEKRCSSTLELLEFIYSVAALLSFYFPIKYQAEFLMGTFLTRGTVVYWPKLDLLFEKSRVPQLILCITPAPKVHISPQNLRPSLE